MQVKIERGNDVNAFLYDAIGAVVYSQKPHTLESAYKALCKCFGMDHPLYWFYKGGNHIAVHHQQHHKRIALISL